MTPTQRLQWVQGQLMASIVVLGDLADSITPPDSDLMQEFEDVRQTLKAQNKILQGLSDLLG